MLSNAEKTSYEVWTADPDGVLDTYARLAVFRERMTLNRDALTRARDYIRNLAEADRPSAFIVKVTREVIA